MCVKALSAPKIPSRLNNSLEGHLSKLYLLLMSACIYVAIKKARHHMQFSSLLHFTSAFSVYLLHYILHPLLPNNYLLRIFSTMCSLRISCLLRAFYLTMCLTFHWFVCFNNGRILFSEVRSFGRVHKATWFRSPVPHLLIKVPCLTFNSETALFCCFPPLFGPLHRELHSFLMSGRHNTFS
jgi:hypothetical protein